MKNKLSSAGNIDGLEKRILALETELQSLRVSDSAPAANIWDQVSVKRITLRAHFGRVSLERMPFVVTLDGPERLSRTLTPVRTAILLVLLIDFLERSESGNSRGSKLERIEHALKTLAPEENVSNDALRMAFSRASSFVADEFSGTVGDDISFAVKKGELAILQQGRAIPPDQVSLEITASDQIISAFLDVSLATSPLARLRKTGSLFIPPGDMGQDRILSELLDHEYPVKQISLFYRPTIQSFPPELLRRFRVNDARASRPELALRGYQSGRCAYTEILPRRIIWDMIRRDPGKGFSLYPLGAAASDVIQHIDHLQFLVRSFPNYELVITDAFFPFYITTFEITREKSVERYVMFFQNSEVDNISSVSTFALKDDSIFFSAQERIIRWMLSHATTIRNREQVLAELSAVRTALIESEEDPIMPLTKAPLASNY